MTTAPEPEFLPRPGGRVVCSYQKFDGSPHWTYDMVFLGTDALGDWCGIPTDTLTAKPTAQFRTASASVQLFPRNRYYVAMFNDAHPKVPIRIYCDLTTLCRWDARGATMIDMDLDVVVPRIGYLFLDDRDEFEVHRERYGYPQDLIDNIEAEARDLQQDLSSETSILDRVGTAHLADYAAGKPFDPNHADEQSQTP